VPAASDTDKSLPSTSDVPVSDVTIRPAATLSSSSRNSLRFPPLSVDAGLNLSTAAFEFFASVNNLTDVLSVVSDASIFCTRHACAYHKVWARWESQRMTKELRLHLPLLPDAAVHAAASAAAAVATWPWWMPRLDATMSMFVKRTVIGAIPETFEEQLDSSLKLAPQKKKRSPKKVGSNKSSKKVVTAQALAEAASERVLRMPLRHDFSQMMTECVLEHSSALMEFLAEDKRAKDLVTAAARSPPMQKEALNAAAAGAQAAASTSKDRLSNIMLPPLLQFTSDRSKLHSLLSKRDGKALQQMDAKDETRLSLADLQLESLRALLHPALASSPHLVPFHYCENSTDPSWLAEAPASWILAMSGVDSGDQLQSIHEELLSQWEKFCSEALQSPIPKTVGIADVPPVQPWHDRLATLCELHGSSSPPKPDALTVLARAKLLLKCFYVLLLFFTKFLMKCRRCVGR
jgi:hypothetical protein